MGVTRGEASEPEMIPLEAARSWEAEGLPILQMDLRLPQPAEHWKGRAARQFCRYYQFQRRAFAHRCEHWLLPQARTACTEALEAGVPPVCFRAELDYTITRCEKGLCSLLTRAREQTGVGPASLVQWGDTWDLRSGSLLPLSAFYPPGAPWKQQLLQAAAASIEAQEASGIARYREDWHKALRRAFNPRNFYLTDTGLCFFYGMYSIAPAVEGIPSFTIPYGPDGPCPSPF